MKEKILLGKPHFVFDRIESTNDIAAKLADFDYPEGTAVSARTQTKGRGRLGRKWISPKGKNVYLSLILKPKGRTKDILLISLVGALAVAKTVKKYCKKKVEIKWPNDVYINGKKVSGILCEIKIRGNTPSHLIMGIGINLNSKLKNFPQAIKKRSTSILLETGRSMDEKVLLAELFKNLSKFYSLWKNGQEMPLIEITNNLLFAKGEIISFTEGGKRQKAKIVKVNNNGSLRVIYANLHKDIISGEINIE